MNVQNAVLVALNISSWDANRRDRRASLEVAEANNVQDQRLCRLRKSLLPKSDVMSRLYAVIRAARNFHYENTLPWMHDGPRMLLTSNFDEYSARMRAFTDEFESAVLDVAAEYDNLKTAAQQALGGLFDEQDYPPVDWLKTRYGFDIKYLPVPADESFAGLGLEVAQADEIRSKLEADLRETYERANRQLWEDLYARMEKLKDCLSDPKSRFRDGTIRAVGELAHMLPKLNITNDDRLAALGKRLCESFGELTADDVRADARVREQAAAEARSVVNAMSAFMVPALMNADEDEAGQEEGEELRRAA